MNIEKPVTFVYLLVDNGLLAEVAASYSEDELHSRPTWLAPIYAERALAVSPLLIDLEAAYEAGALDQVMRYLNALQPALHVSIIETELNLEQLAQHLRRFIFILDPEGKQFTFRYADCAILALLPSVLTPAQWGHIAGPMTRWQIHDRSGGIFPLPSSIFVGNEPIPLRLGEAQLAALDEASEPDHYIAKVKMMGGQDRWPGTQAEQHAWALAARRLWLASENKHSLALMLFTEATLKTRGELLLQESIENLFAISEFDTFRMELNQLSNKIFKKYRE
jgi:hypothetical protein